MLYQLRPAAWRKESPAGVPETKAQIHRVIISPRGLCRYKDTVHLQGTKYCACHMAVGLLRDSNNTPSFSSPAHIQLSNETQETSFSRMSKRGVAGPSDGR